MSFDSHFEDAIARGKENARVIQLAHNHCLHMEFVPFGGQGMLEPTVGLPINMRKIRCIKAHGTTAGFQLGSVARQFYTENCIGCELRRPSGQVPTLAGLVEAEERQEAEAALIADAEKAEAEALREQRVRKRGALRVSADPAMGRALKDLDVLDASDDERASAALRRLTALAQKAPDTFSEVVVAEMLILVGFGRPTILKPLRILARTQTSWQRDVVDAALAVLETWAAEDAARVLVQFRNVTRTDDFTASVVRSLLYVAYGPLEDDFGYSGESRSTDPATLKLLADRASDTLMELLEDMLPGPPSLSGLELPPGNRSPTATVHSSRSRATAAGAIAQLLIMDEPIAPRFVPALVRNLLTVDDEMEGHSHAAVQRALGLFIVRGVGGAEEAWAATGESASDEQRGTLFKVWWFLSQLVDPDRGWQGEEPKLSDEDRQQLRARVFETSMLRLAGGWGYDVAGQAADIILDLARDAPDWAASQIDVLLGGFITANSAADQPRSQVLVPTNDLPDSLAQMEWATRQMVLRSAASRCLDAVEYAAQADPSVALDAVVKFLSHERDEEKDWGVSARLLRVLGNIGRNAGQRPGVLTVVVPVLYTNLMSSSPALVATAIRAWAEVASRNPLPSLFEDLLPVLMENQYIAVITALLESLPRLRLTEDAMRSGLRFAVTWFASSQVGGPNSSLVGPSVECVGRLLQRLPEDNVALERTLLKVSAALPAHEINDVLRVNWSAGARKSVEYAQIRLGRVGDPTYNSPFNRRHDTEEVALLECGQGLVGLGVADLEAAAQAPGPERILAGLHIVEVAWRANRADDARAICERLEASIPKTPAFDRQRALTTLVNAAISGDDPPHVDEEPTDENGFPSLVFSLHAQSALRLSIRRLLTGTAGLSSVGSIDAAALSLEGEATKLAEWSQRATPTAAYLRLVAELCVVAAHLLRLEAAEMDRDDPAARARRRTVKRSASSLAQRVESELGADDPLGALLSAELIRVLQDEANVDPIALVGEWASLPLPLIIIEGAPLEAERPTERDEVLVPEAVAVAMISVDDRQLTGPAVLQRDTVYSLGVKLQVDQWPVWADRLDLELVGGLSAKDIQLPAMTWKRSDGFDGVLTGEGTLVLRFALPAGRPAPPFVIAASWSGSVKGKPRIERLDIAGHAQIRLRPFDASRDALTTYDIVDEHLLALYSSLAGDFPDDEVQAFCRLFTAVCRSGFRFTWEKKYRRGARVTERQFHDDLFADLLADPELEGRVERGNSLALGYLDIRHDRITAELKVERRVPVTETSAPKYMGQATQYASADGRHLSILAILDMSPKELTVGTPENYVFTLVPALHGLDSPEAPSLVAVVVVNGNMPVPSSWSRRKPKRMGEYPANA